jgi:hypothetical protein
VNILGCFLLYLDKMIAEYDTNFFMWLSYLSSL